MISNTQTYNEMWQQCLAHLRTQTTEEEFSKWFEPIVPLEFDGTTLRLRVPNASYVYQIEKNYLKFLRPIISQLYGLQTKLFYAVPKPVPAPQPEVDTTEIRRAIVQNDTANIQNPLTIPGLRRLKIDPNLSPGLPLLELHRGQLQPAGPLGRHGYRDQPRQQPVQSPIYIR